MNTLLHFILISGLTLSTTLAIAQPLYGLWGNETQCTRALMSPAGTKHASPFNINADWLQHGDVWCRLNWVGAPPTQQDTFATANALCGEDAVRNYQIRLNLIDNMLTISWNRQLVNGPLKRCAN